MRKFTKVNGESRVYRTWADWEEGDVVIGQFVSQGTDQYQKNNYTIKVLEADLGDKKLSKELVGKNLCLNSSGMLDKAMATIELDKKPMLEITYDGTATIEKGKYKGKESHIIKVGVDYGDGLESTSDLDDDL